MTFLDTRENIPVNFIMFLENKQNNMFIYFSSKVGDRSGRWPESSIFASYYTKVLRRIYSFPGLLHFTLDPYLIMLSIKQGSIKYHFLSLWYDSTWDWAQVSRAIGEHSNHHAKRVECSSMVRETGVQSHVAYTKDFKNGTWYLHCLTLSNIRYESKVKWSNTGKE